MWAIRSEQCGLFLTKKGSEIPYTAYVQSARKFHSEEAAWKEATKTEKPVNLDKMRRKW
jgi:hypothetical protein